ncbi:hypothetical protein FB451DRAFT_1277441 [Mycena latifolia]|nr:hypothetical protein FB451DRAFT_1277441 [Mycena latifolia]
MSWPICESCSEILKTIPADIPEQLHANLAEIKSAILRHKACIAALEERQREAEKDLTRALVVYPVLTLPNEIISRIFVECLPSHGRVRPSRRRAPLLLAQICRHWREIALSTCQLWTSVDIDTGFPQQGMAVVESVSDGVVFLLQTWFSRAGSCPLSLTFRSSYRRLPMTVLSIIPSVAGQLHRLELSLSSEDLQSVKQLCISLPHLQRLAIDSEHFRHTNSPELRPISIFPNTPSLRDLSIHHQRSSISELNMYPNLTSLQLPRVSPGMLLQILGSRPQIMQLTAYLDKSAPLIPAPTTVIHLHSLTMGGDLKSAEAALNCLTIPNLVRLELHIGFALKPSCLLSFLKRSACALDHLALAFNYSRSFIDCFTALPSLTSLRVEVNHYTMVHFRELLDAHALLPRLRALSIRVDTEKFDYTVLIKALRERRSRTASAHRIEFLRLNLYQDSYDDDDDEDAQWLPPRVRDDFMRLRADGVQVRVIWESEEGWPERWVDRCESFP